MIKHHWRLGVSTILAAFALCTLPGCMATSAALSAGTTHLDLVPREAFADQHGNVYVAVELERSHSITRGFASGRGRSSSLGPRYLILNAPGYRNAIESAAAVKRRGHTRPTLRVSPRAKTAARSAPPSQLSGWYLYPPDASRRTKSIELPPYLDESQWHRISPTGNRSNRPEITLEATIDGQPSDVQLSTHALSRRYMAWWGGPVKLLVIPAIPIDIITFPFQAAYVANLAR